VWGSFSAVMGKGATGLALFPVASATAQPPPGRETICVRHVAFQAAHSIYFEDPDGHQLEITTYETVASRRVASRICSLAS
jgi:catechol 2,3-dioxygenase-like lactoylglutathione lyase family enzyme